MKVPFAFAFLGVALPPVVVAILVICHGITLPFRDAWELAPLLVADADGRLGFVDFWQQHNEHRVLIPRLVMFGLARLTGWDIRYELAANYLSALLVLAVLTALILRTVRPLAPRAVPCLIAAASVATFSTQQWENWTWGWQLQIFACALAAVASVWALTALPGPWRVVVALVAAAAGVFLFSTGVILLALVPLGLFLRRWSAPETVPFGELAAAVVAASVIGAIYFVGFRFVSEHPDPLYAFSHPLRYGLYVLAYTGAAPALWSKWMAVLWGLAGIAVFAVSAIDLWVRAPLWRAALLPWVLLGIYGVLSGCVIGIGRAGFGVQQALHSRYVTLSSLFWISLIVILTLSFWQADRRRGKPVWGVVSIAMLAGALLATSFPLSAAYGWRAAAERHRVTLRGGDCLRRYEGASDECLRTLYPSPAVVRERARLRVRKNERAGE